MSSAPPQDIFRDTPIRYLGYANEIGEAFRAVVHRRWVNLSYGVASGYVLCDAGSKAWNSWSKSDPCDSGRWRGAAVAGTDALIWQAFASVIIPGFTINRICAGTRWTIRRAYPYLPCRVTRNAKWITVLVGLASIPYIIHPIDELVTAAMDASIRPIMHSKGPCK
ncbi:hypothetical protein AAG570_005364 [Ranatra chinensis]|uniref:Mitochondrial fission process protein 1 n=1 Tax=Ranatra chinensis TaxID=642074 RepID=A0ABD0Y1S4_9HEMI